MNILFLIPARKGSKGLPGKNTKKLGDKSLIEYSIDFAIEHCEEQDEICISTNDEDVIKISNSKKIMVPFIRPEELANDNANITDVILHALNHYESKNKFFDSVLLLQPTFPFRTNEDFKNLISLYNSENDMVVSVKISKENPYFTIFEEDRNGFLKKSKESNFTRRQDCPSSYLYNGSMYLINTDSIKKQPINLFTKIIKYIMPEQRSIDIDTLMDFKLAELYLRENDI